MVFATVSLASALASPAGPEKIVPSAFAQTTVVALFKVLAFRPDNANAKGLGVERTAPFVMQSARLTAHCMAFAIRENASASMDMRVLIAPSLRRTEILVAHRDALPYVLGRCITALSQ